jgi:hypothetical protein
MRDYLAKHRPDSLKNFIRKVGAPRRDLNPQPSDPKCYSPPIYESIAFLPRLEAK